jgi:hypothetical protein
LHKKKIGVALTLKSGLQIEEIREKKRPHIFEQLFLLRARQGWGPVEKGGQ